MKELEKSKKQALELFRRYHIVLFFALLAISLSVVVAIFYGIVEKASGQQASLTDANTGRFDEETINRISELKTSDEPSVPLDFSGRRISPFDE